MKDLLNTIVLSPIIEKIITTPDNNAFWISGEYYTYSYLGDVISEIRRSICNFDLSAKCVGLVANNDIETYASIFALMLEGICYVPLHPEWPIERCIEICRQCDIDTILDSSDSSKYDAFRILKTKGLDIADGSFLNSKAINGDDLLCIMFTSGSTGKPKGVQLTRNSVATAISCFEEGDFQITQEDRCTQCFDLTFAASIQCFVSALKRGACCYTVPYDQIKYLYLASLIEDYRISFTIIPASLLKFLRPLFGDFDTESLRTCLVTSEGIKYDLASEWLDCAKNMTLYNLYGSTECSGACLIHKVDRVELKDKSIEYVPIGRPISTNIACLILNSDGVEVCDGERGELCVSGEQLSKGYWKEYEITASSFFQMRQGDSIMRFYHTGDSCYKDTNGVTHCLGRTDSQLKIQGFRVDLSEIEVISSQYLNKDVVCIPFEKTEDFVQIAIFVETESSIQKDGLLLMLKDRLPSYMIPSQVIEIRNFPYNANGKVDRNELVKMLS